MVKHGLRKLYYVVGLSILFVACGSDDETTPIIKLGSHFPITGNLAVSGTSEYQGVQIAIADFMADSGLEVELAFYDDESSADKAAEVVEKLIVEDGVVAISAGYGSALIAQAKAVTEEHGIPYIASGGVGDSLVADDPEFFFRINNSGGYSEGVAKLVLEVINGDKVGGDIQKVAMITESSSGNDSMSNYLQTLLENAGLTITGRARFTRDTGSCDTSEGTCVASEAQVCNQNVDDPHAECRAFMDEHINTAMGGQQPDILIMVAYAKDYEAVLRRATSMDLDLQAFIGAWSMASSWLAAMGEEVEDIYGTTGWEFDEADATPIETHFVQEMKDRFDVDTPDYLNMYGYVQTTVLLQAAERVIDAGEKLTPTNIRDELRRTDFRGPTGLIAFQDNGDPKYFVAWLFQIQDGVRKVVSPPEEAPVDPVFPKVPWRTQ